MSMLYLDNAATTPVRPEVLEAMMPYLTRWYGNPSSHHTVGEAAAEALADARVRVARVLGLRPADVVFTSGGTEANNLAIKGIAIAAAQRREDGRVHVITTPIEHESVLESVAYLERVHGCAVTRVPVDAHGRVDPDAVADALRDDTALVTLGYANNEVGTVQDAVALGMLLRDRRVPLHLDAVQPRERTARPVHRPRARERAVGAPHRRPRAPAPRHGQLHVRRHQRRGRAARAGATGGGVIQRIGLRRGQ
jgi:cysteine desulfurase